MCVSHRHVRDHACGAAVLQHTLAHTHTHTDTRTHKHTPGGPRRTGTCKVLTRYSRGAHTTEFSHRLNSAAVRAVTNIRVLFGITGYSRTPTHPAEYAELFRFFRARLRDAWLSGAHPSMVCVAWHRRALQLARYSHARHLWVLYRTLRRLSRLCRALQRRVWHYGVYSCFVWVSYAGVGKKHRHRTRVLVSPPSTA